jgi:hypothetical protein
MMPENTLSSSAIFSAFLVPDKAEPLVDFEWGGVDLLDSSQGLMVKIWKCFYHEGWICITDGVATHQIIQIANVKHVSLAFDFNMHPTIAYVVENEDKTRGAYLYWYDTALGAQTTTLYGPDYLFPQLSLDDHRLHQSANADIIFSYIKNNNLYYRQQRDRFTIERLLESGLSEDVELRQTGMNTKNRFQWLFW